MYDDTTRGLEPLATTEGSDTKCPHCSERALGIATSGPGEHKVDPCGCAVGTHSVAELAHLSGREKQARPIVTDGGEVVADPPDQDVGTDDVDVHPTELHAFQRHILAVLAEESRYGLAIKEELQSYYEPEISNARLYSNLPDLAGQGLIEVSALDKRTNQYELTEAGRDAIETHAHWYRDLLGLLDSEADEEAVYVYRCTSRNAQPKLHFDPECSKLGTSETISRKLLSVFPESHQDWCTQCAPQRADDQGGDA
ncbi:helix-turn-helix transcriptional regulator [Halorarum salinum]|uniref:Helix-turn-helix transcriptional regulator n=1 Tax=Halorarum salinum TaxID=2743089 RepID=A0A7D5QDD8_9EURY|nr:helix-turn-helix transcriptional regulator [Halobaculum salinum]